MTTHTLRVTIIIPASKQAEANAKLQELGFGPNTFSAALIPTTRSPQDPPPTHYLCDWAMTPDDYTRVQNALSGLGASYHPRDHWDSRQGQPTPDQAAAAEGLQRLPGAM